MKIDWYFDVISPFAWLQWPAIRQLATEHEVTPKPILLAGLLDRHGQKGPAEIPGKREFSYRHVLWRARAAGVPLRFPPAHPFNPVAALRLCLAAGADLAAVDAVMAWIWAEGQPADSLDALRPLARRLGIDDVDAALVAPAVKARLRANFDDALAAGVFGVPTLVIAGECFWGEDATAMARAFLADPRLFDDPEYARLATLPVAVQRNPAG